MRLRILPLAGLMLAAASAAQAQDLVHLSLEDLLAQEVSSVAKRPQNVKEAPAAVFVITREDIRRSGATTLPEVLRMAPGLEVAETSEHNAAVTARGFNSTFGNKLLVLVDGRAVYQPITSSVVWSNEYVALEDIKRIEIVRGPGATLYGANAVNGVINIITDHAVDTVGGLASGQVASEGSERAYLRNGFRVGDSGAMRLFGQWREDEQNLLLDGDSGENRSKAIHLGFRFDAEPTANDAFTIQGDGYESQSRVAGLGPSVSPGIETSSHNLLGRWTRNADGGGRTSLQAWYEKIHRQQSNADVTRNVFDLELSRQLLLGRRHDLIVGAGYRHSENRGVPVSPNYRLKDSDQDWYGGFVQDDIALLDRKLRLSVGAKIERNPKTGVEIQPSLRAIWVDPAGWSAWGAVSRAVRTPSDLESDSIVDLRPELPVMLLPAEVDAESVVVVEAGWRGPLGRRAFLDATLFHNTYEDLIGGRGAFQFIDGAPLVVFTLDNLTSAKSYGVEIALDIPVNSRWTLKASGNLTEYEIEPIEGLFQSLGALSSSQSPTSQISIRSLFDVRDDIDLDIWVRHVGELDGGVGDSYEDLDIRLAWRPGPRLEVALQGENLLSSSRIEYTPADTGLVAPAALVERRVKISLRARY